jgi:hypothetical protein
MFLYDCNMHIYHILWFYIEAVKSSPSLGFWYYFLKKGIFAITELARYYLMREFSREEQICPDSGRNLSLKLKQQPHCSWNKIREPCTMQHTTTKDKWQKLCNLVLHQSRLQKPLSYTLDILKKGKIIAICK